MDNVKVDNYIIDTSIKTILDELANTCINGKLSTYKLTGAGWSVPCPCHSNGKEQHPSCFINDTTSEFHCFTCDAKGYLPHFVSYVLDMSLIDAKNWLIRKWGKQIDSLSSIASIPFMTLGYKKTIPTKKDDIVVQKYHPYLVQRKLNIDICNKFGVGYDNNSQCIIFPVYDEHNKFVMYTKRSVNSKVFIIDKDVEKPVYLLNEVLKLNPKSVVVCESQINALYAWSLGFPAVALFGTGTEHQYKILNKSGIRYYKLCFDGDLAGDKGRDRFINHIKNAFIDIINIPRGKDLNDLDEKEAKELLNGILTSL